MSTVEPRPTYGRCWCGRPIRRPGEVECAEHDDPPPLPDCSTCGHEAHDAEGCEAWWVVGESTEVRCDCRDYRSAPAEPEPRPLVEVTPDPWSTPSTEPPPF